jgi:hypothetical protein
MPIKNLQRDVGEVRSRYPGPVREIVCMQCHLAKTGHLVERTRRVIGLTRCE